MTQYDRTNSGLLARNDKQGNESRPDYRGSINVNGVEYWLSAWIKQGREGTKLEGQKYMSLSVQPKDAAAPAPAPTAAPAPAAPRRPTQAEQDARYSAERRAREAAPRAASGTGFDSMDDDIPF
jgi:single-stranded DNA-binding protein